MDKLPPEINRIIYSFINPISTPIKKTYNIVWCKYCGEILSNGEWYISVSPDFGFMSYSCNNCEYENIYDINIDGDYIDILIDQERL